MRCSSRERVSARCWLTMGWMAYMSFGSFSGSSCGAVWSVVSSLRTAEVSGSHRALRRARRATLASWASRNCRRIACWRSATISRMTAGFCWYTVCPFGTVDGGATTADAVGWWEDRAGGAAVLREPKSPPRGGKSGSAFGAEPTTPGRIDIGAAGHGQALRVAADHRGTSFGARSGGRHRGCLPSPSRYEGFSG